MHNPDTELDILINKLRKNFHELRDSEKVTLREAELPEKPGVYMIFFGGKLQYIGESGEGKSAGLLKRIGTNLKKGTENHTLNNKLCKLKSWEKNKIVDLWKDNSSKIKFIATENEDDAKLLEDVMITIHHPVWNKGLKELKKSKEEGHFDPIDC